MYVLLHGRNGEVKGRVYIPASREANRASYNITTHRLTSVRGGTALEYTGNTGGGCGGFRGKATVMSFFTAFFRDIKH